MTTQRDIAALQSEFDSLVNQYNAATDNGDRGALSSRIQSLRRQISQAQDPLNQQRPRTAVATPQPRSGTRGGPYAQQRPQTAVATPRPRPQTAVATPQPRPGTQGGPYATQFGTGTGTTGFADEDPSPVIQGPTDPRRPGGPLDPNRPDRSGNTVQSLQQSYNSLLAQFDSTSDEGERRGIAGQLAGIAGTLGITLPAEIQATLGSIPSPTQQRPQPGTQGGPYATQFGTGTGGPGFADENPGPVIQGPQDPRRPGGPLDPNRQQPGTQGGPYATQFGTGTGGPGFADEGINTIVDPPIDPRRPGGPLDPNRQQPGTQGGPYATQFGTGTGGPGFADENPDPVIQGPTDPYAPGGPLDPNRPNTASVSDRLAEFGTGGLEGAFRRSIAARLGNIPAHSLLRRNLEGQSSSYLTPFTGDILATALRQGGAGGEGTEADTLPDLGARLGLQGDSFGGLFEGSVRRDTLGDAQRRSLENLREIIGIESQRNASPDGQGDPLLRAFTSPGDLNEASLAYNLGVQGLRRRISPFLLGRVNTPSARDLLGEFRAQPGGVDATGFGKFAYNRFGLGY